MDESVQFKQNKAAKKTRSASVIQCVCFFVRFLDGGNMNEFFLSRRFRQKTEDTTYLLAWIVKKKNKRIGIEIHFS